MSAETLQQELKFSTEYENLIQLVWIRPAAEVVIDLAAVVVENIRGRYTEFIDVPLSWEAVNRRSLTRASCRNEAWRLLNPNVFTR